MIGSNVGSLHTVPDESIKALVIQKLSFLGNIMGQKSVSPADRQNMKYGFVAFWMALMFIQCHDTIHPSASMDIIAFVSRDNKVNHIYLMDIDPAGHGSQARRLTSDVESEDYPSWSPDGKMLAYHRGDRKSVV